MLHTLGLHINSFDGKVHSGKGGLIVCASCRRILGYLNGDGYREVQMILRCRCGNTGQLKTRLPWQTPGAARLLRAQGSEYRCEDCARPLFSLRKDELYNFSFRIVCACGASYELDVTEEPGRTYDADFLRAFYGHGTE